MAALRAGQQKQPADEAMWVRCASTERQRASEAVAAAKQRGSEEELERAAAEFEVFFDRAMSLSVLTGAEFDALKSQIAQGEASKGQLVLAWRPALHQKEAQQNAGLFAALDETVTECILELLSMKGLARIEQTCVYFSGTLDPAARERLRRKTRCARLLRICLRTEPAAPPEVAALGPSIERYCTTLLDDPDQALEAVLSTCVPVLLDSFRKSRSQQGVLLCPALEALQTLRTGMTTARREAFWRCYLRIRADWLRSKTKQERDRLTEKRYGLIVMEGDEDGLLAALRLARVEHVLFAEDMVALLHTIYDLNSRRNEAPGDLAHDDEATVSDWVAAYDAGRAMAGVDLEVLLTLDKLLTDRRWYEPHPEIRESLHTNIQNTFRATVNTLERSPLRDALVQHLMQFHAIYHRGPNRFFNLRLLRPCLTKIPGWWPTGRRCSERPRFGSWRASAWATHSTCVRTTFLLPALNPRFLRWTSSLFKRCSSLATSSWGVPSWAGDLSGTPAWRHSSRICMPWLLHISVVIPPLSNGWIGKWRGTPVWIT